MSRGRRLNGAKAAAPVEGAAVDRSKRERLVLEPAERKAALLHVIGSAKRRLVLSLFRCDDFSILDALASALERGCDVEAIVTKRAKGGRKRLKKLWGALEEMGAVVTRYADPVVKYHAKYVVADDGPAIVTTLNPTRKCFSKTWDAVLVTHDPAVVRGLLSLFKNDVQAKALVRRKAIGSRLIVGPEHSRGEIRRLVAGAKSSIRIIDHKLSDPDLVGLLRDRRNEGITVSVLGKRSFGALVPHGKMMIIDETLAIMGSTALSTLSLDFRREVSVIIDDPVIVRKLNVMYQQLSAKAGATAAHLPGDRIA